MGFLSYGSAKALSITHDFQQDIDRVYQREAYRTQVQAEKERKASYYATLMKEETAVAPFNVRRLEEFYGQLHKDIADFAINNPGWETDVTKVNQFQQMADQFINNPIIREDQEVQKEWNSTKDAINKGEIKPEEYDEMAERYSTYKQTGGDPYIFLNPKRKDIMQILKEGNDYLEPITKVIEDPDTGKLTKIGKTPDENINLAAAMMLRDKDTDFIISKTYNSIPEEQKGLYKSKTDYLSMLLKAGEAAVYEDTGEYDQKALAAHKKSLDNNSDLSNYHRFYYNQVYESLREKGETSSDNANISFTEFGSKGQPLTMGPNGRNFKMYNKEGNRIEDINIRGNIVSLGAGKVINYGGIPWVQTQVMVSLNDNQVLLDLKGDPIQEQKNLTTEQQIELKKKRSEDSKLPQVEDKLLSTALSEHGFTIQKITDPGMLAGLGLEGQTITSDVYVGTVLLPADFSEGNRMKYDTYYGATKEGLSKGASLYSENINIEEMIRSGNSSVASSIINSKKLKNIATETGHGIDNLAWIQDSEDPYIWYSKVDDRDIKYNFKDNKVYISQ